MNDEKSKSYYVVRTAVRAAFWTVSAAWGLATLGMFFNLLFS